MPSPKGMMKSQTTSAIDAVPKSAWPHGRVDDQRNEQDLRRDAGEDELVAHEAAGEHRLAFAAAEEDVHDLHDDDGARDRQSWLADREGRCAANFSPKCQPAVAQDEPIRAHRGSGLHRPEEEIGAGEERPVQQPVGARTRRCFHDVRGGLFCAETERGQHVGAEIDGQDLDDRERQRNAEKRQTRDRGSAPARSR